MTLSANAYSELLMTLSQVIKFLTAGELTKAMYLAQKMLKKYPNHPEVLFAVGAVARKQGNLDLALGSFRKSLTIDKTQSQVYNHLALTLSEMKDFKEANVQYHHAIRYAKNKAEPIKNLCLMLMSQKQYVQASRVLTDSHELLEENMSLKKLLGDNLREQNKIEKAIAIYRQVLAVEPHFINADHNLGVCLKQTKCYDEAMVCFQRVLKRNPDIYQAKFNLAGIQVSLGDLESAEEAYINLLQEYPEYVEAHQCLNELYWQLGRKNELGKSYQQVIKRFPKNVHLIKAYADLIMSIGDFTMAEKIVDAGLVIQPNAALLGLKAKLTANKGEFDSASHFLHRSLEEQFSTDYALDLVQIEIKRRDYKAAMSLTDRVEKHQPENQLNWALRGTIWRVLNDTRYTWLNNYQRFVRDYTLPTPVGYRCLTDFLTELSSTLHKMHQFIQEPLQQTLKNGSQIPGGLFETDNELVQLLVTSIKIVIDQYVRELPREDPSHPLLSRKNRPYHIAGSWSVKLRDQGFHVNHVHPQGWISCCVYIDVPDAVVQRTQTDKNAGCIKFGESSLGLAEKDEPELILSPKPGMLAIFPSYMWHGTVPFDKNTSEYRLTTPFDVGN